MKQGINEQSALAKYPIGLRLAIDERVSAIARPTPPMALRRLTMAPKTSMYTRLTAVRTAGMGRFQVLMLLVAELYLPWTRTLAT